MEKSSINFLLYGENSFLNKGCESIVNTTIKKIRKISNGKIILSTNDINDQNTYNNTITKYVKGWYSENELTEEEKEKIKYYKTLPFDYMNFEKIYCKDCINQIQDVDICLSIGGDNYCYGEPNWMYAINRCIAEKNKKNVLWGASLFEEITSSEMIRDLKTYDLLVVRETLTYIALSQLTDKERIMLLPDTAFSLEKKEVKLPQILNQGKKVIGINISPLISKYTSKSEKILESVKYLIDQILCKTDYMIALIPHVYIEGNNDLDSLKIIKDLYKEEKRIELLDEKIYSSEELKYIISKCSFLIAARTHASIAGYSSCVPTLVIGYSVKSKGIALDLFGNFEDYVIPVEQITPRILQEKVKKLIQNEQKIKETLNYKMPIYKEKAEHMLEDVIQKLEELENKYVTHTSKCTGCMACLNICPNNAIELKTNKEGFTYTIINQQKCTRCGLCKKVCPINNEYKSNEEEKKYFAATNKNEQERIKSSSGGIICAIAKNILKQKGTVYGVQLENKKAQTIRIEDEKDLYKIMGSKYVQSEIGFILQKVKEDLLNNKKVLYTGTPCQIEGLKRYLQKPYENLICIAIICHGVPSPEVFKKYIQEKETQNNSEIININFRNKSQGWHNYQIEYTYKNGKKELIPYSQDIYMSGFLKDYFLRESCYNCQMKFKQKSTSDIIIGDFWGVENLYPEFDDNKGISAIIINSKKGLEEFGKINEQIKYQEINLEDINKFNMALTKSFSYKKQRDVFFKLLENNEVQTAIQALDSTYLKEELTQKNKQIEQMEANLKDLNKWVDELVEAKEFFLKQMAYKDKKIQETEAQIKKLDTQILELNGENNNLKKRGTNKLIAFAKKVVNTLKK